MDGLNWFCKCQQDYFNMHPDSQTLLFYSITKIFRIATIKTLLQNVFVFMRVNTSAQF